MENISSVIMGVAMVAAFLLVAGGARLAFDRQTRGRGLLMIACGIIFIGNVLIWTL